MPTKHLYHGDKSILLRILGQLPINPITDNWLLASRAGSFLDS